MQSCLRANKTKPQFLLADNTVPTVNVILPAHISIQDSFLLQVIPVLLQLVQAISSVRLYIPKDLRPLDARQNVGKSIQVRGLAAKPKFYVIFNM